MRKLILVILLFTICAQAHATVIFNDNFDAWDDWTVAQGIGGESSCGTEPCSIGSWTLYRNQGNLCGSGVTGRPGYNNIYIDAIAGYPTGSDACYGGSGKCWTHWIEACQSWPTFDDADALFIKHITEVDELYLSFRIKFPTTFQWNLVATDALPMIKLWHIYHRNITDGAFTFHVAGENHPLTVGGISGYSTSVYLYTMNSGWYTTGVPANGMTYWPIGTITTVYQAGNLFDGNWHQIIIRAKTNTSKGATDGLVELWLDGVKKSYLEGYEGTGLVFNKNEAEVTENRGWGAVSVGGNNTTWLTGGSACSTAMGDCEQYYSIDSVCVTTTYAEAESGTSNNAASPTLRGGIIGRIQ